MNLNYVVGIGNLFDNTLKLHFVQQPNWWEAIKCATPGWDWSAVDVDTETVEPNLEEWKQEAFNCDMLIEVSEINDLTFSGPQ